METIELEFLLKLLEFEDYRAPLSEIKLSSTTSDTEREQICRNLCDRGFLVCSYKVKKFKIASPGKFLLKQESDNLLLTKEELKVLQASAKDTISAKETGIPAEERQTVIQSLAARGLIQVKAKHKKIQEVWLSERGEEYLQYEYNPDPSSSVFNPELLTNYLQFLRESFQKVPPQASRATQTISDDKILLTIVELERRLATNNRLPIFHLREKLHPLVSREELDDALYRLQQLDKIELSALQAASACTFTSEQIEAGISHEGGTPLFFVTLK
jgi:hypothetical protein